MKPQNGFTPAAQLGSFDDTICGEATSLLIASRAMQRGVKAFKMKLHTEAISTTPQLSGINDTQCGDTTFSQSAYRATETREEACSLKLRNKWNPATAQLGGFDYTHCGDATLLQNASRIKKSNDEVFTLKLREELIPAAQLDGIDDTHCGDATLSQSTSRAKKTSDEAFTLKLREELIPAASDNTSTYVPKVAEFNTTPCLWGSYKPTWGTTDGFPWSPALGCPVGQALVPETITHDSESRACSAGTSSGGNGLQYSRRSISSLQ
jgi:hypothetical protein